MRFVSNKERREIINKLENILKTSLDDVKKEDILYDEEKGIYIANRVPIAFIYENNIYPTIFLIVNRNIDLPYVVVDNGAKEKILNGADVFRPGIIEFSEDIKKGDIVMILSSDGKLLGIGISLMDYEEIKNSNKGKVIKNLHYFGDKITELYKNLNK